MKSPRQPSATHFRHRRTEIDVLVISSNTTPGLQRDFQELLAALRKSGVSFAVATSNYGLVGRGRSLAWVLDEMIVLGALRYATTRALRRFRPKALLITTAAAGGFLPRGLLHRAGIRFDGLVATSRPGWRDAPSRAVERRCLRLARVVLPYTHRAAAQLTPAVAEPSASVVWPSPVRPGPPAPAERLPAALCYGNNPIKKGLDLAVQAWAISAPHSHRLLITGIEAADGKRFLRERGVTPPANVQWLGRLPELEYRRLSASVLLYLGASRVDEFATTQLEALADGALLVTAPSKGPIEALALANKLDPRLVAKSVTAEALASAIKLALALSPAEQADYRRRAQSLLAPYSRQAFTNTLRMQVLPLLLGQPNG